MAKLRGHQIKFSDILESEEFKSYKRRIIFDAKKEVFDDIEKHVEEGDTSLILGKFPEFVDGKDTGKMCLSAEGWYWELKKRHLSNSSLSTKGAD